MNRLASASDNPNDSEEETQEETPTNQEETSDEQGESSEEESEDNLASEIFDDSTDNDEEEEESETDELFDEEEEGEDGKKKPKHIPYDRFQKTFQRMKDAESKVGKLEKVSKTVEELYDFADNESSRLDAVRFDNRLGNTVFDILSDDNADDKLKQTLHGLVKFVKGEGEIPTMSNTANNQQPTKTQRDPEFEKMKEHTIKQAQRHLSSQVETVTKRVGVTPEVAGLIRDSFLGNADPMKDYDDTDIIEHIKSLKEKYGWTKEFLTGKKAKTKSSPPTSAGGSSTKGGGKSQKKEKKDEPEKAKSPEDIERKLSSRLAGFLQSDSSD